MTTLTEKAWFVALMSIGLLYIIGIILAMRSKPYPFQDDLKPIPIVMGALVVMFLFLIWMMFSGREEKKTVRGK